MRLLIIGNLGGQLGAASKIARDRGVKVRQAPDIESAMNSLRSGQGADLAMVDVGADIKKLVDDLARERFSLPVVACGVNSDADAAVKAIRAGAKEYIPLPPDEELIAAVFAAITEESRAMIAGSEAMKKVIALADQIAPSDASVLITGESGTGKEVISHYLHTKSKRLDHQFISLNCAAIPENLLESELFGHEKGAFTGAVARRIGKFEEASGGTLLLDEISEMDLRLQAKILRAIQEREIVRVGGSETVKVDIRIIATSNRNLPEEVKKGTFREDLYYRLNVITIHLPPLRERKEDIIPIAEHFIAKYSEANGLAVKPLSEMSTSLLTSYSWPGNVRELENTMHRAVLLSTSGKIEPESIMLSPGVTAGTQTGENTEMKTSANAENQPPAVKELIGRTVDSVERELILGTLDHCLGNRTNAANILGISIRTLRNKLRQYNQEGIFVPPAPAGEEE